LKEAIKQFIVNKARKIFEEKGYNNTTIEEIALAANISKPTLYNYFQGKEEIFRAVLEVNHTDLDNIIIPIVKGPEPFPQRLETLIYSLLNYLNENKGIFKIFIFESRMFIAAIEKENSPGFQELFKKREDRRKIIKSLLSSGIDEGFINDGIPLDLMTTYFSGILMEFGIGYILRDQSEQEVDFKSITATIIDMLKNGIFKK
jgi:AcrR family transcriptional regulator